MAGACEPQLSTGLSSEMRTAGVMSREALPARVVDEVYWMCGGTCAKCKTRLAPRRGLANSFEVDHIHPRSRGGGDDIWNLQPLCQRCNAAKSNLRAVDY